MQKILSLEYHIQGYGINWEGAIHFALELLEHCIVDRIWFIIFCFGIWNIYKNTLLQDEDDGG